MLFFYYFTYFYRIKTIFLIIFLSIQCITICFTDMMWDKEVGEEMMIGPSTEGYKRVELRCGAEHMLVQIETTNDFGGVIYTRGSFEERTNDCFKDVNTGTIFTMKIPFDSCNTRKDGNIFTNTLILQHDDDLIMPGDAAFRLECDFSQPRDIPVHTSMPTDLFDIVSRITLSDADPREREIPDSLKMFIKNNSNTVVFRPRLLMTKDEL